MMTSRINFIDLRDGIYAFEPGAKLKTGGTAEGHQGGPGSRPAGLRGGELRRSRRAEQDAVIALFKEFIELGANALWASFDDKGPGEDPKADGAIDSGAGT